MEDQLNEPNNVICPCRHCEEHIEFDAHEFAEEFSLVPCPHCGLETRIHLPPEPVGNVTEAQLDYIRRLGFNPPATLRFQEACDLIEESLQSAKATGKQLELIRSLGGNADLGFSRADADQIISKLLAKQSQPLAADELPMVRQIQILRFWDRIDLIRSSKMEVAMWLNQFYDEDPRRQAAWETFKSEYGDVWLDEPSWVPMGMGESYLKK